MFTGNSQLTAHHQNWLSDLAHTLGFADVSHVIDMQGFVLHDIGFFFFENDPIKTDHIWMQCLMGELPKTDLGASLTRLLQMQFLMLGQDGPTFGIDSNGKQLIASISLQPSKLETIQMLLLLQNWVDMAQQWQAHQFSQPYSSKDAASSANNSGATPSEVQTGSEISTVAELRA